NSILLGFITLPNFVLTLPSTTVELGSSFGVLNGLFSSLAVILALVAVFIQGRELQYSTQAQRDQVEELKHQVENQRSTTEAIIRQLEQQHKTNSIHLLHAEHQFHSSEIARMDTILDKIEGDFSKKNLFDNSKAKKSNHIAKLGAIEKRIEKLAE